MNHPKSKRKDIVSTAKHGAHQPHDKQDSAAKNQPMPPVDPEDPDANASPQPDEQTWEYEDERSLRDYIEDPDEPSSL